MWRTSIPKKVVGELLFCCLSSEGLFKIIVVSYKIIAWLEDTLTLK